MRSKETRTGLMLAGVVLCQLSLVAPKGLADQPIHISAPVAGAATSNLIVLEDRLGQLQTQLLPLRSQTLRKFMDDPASSLNWIEVYLVTDDQTLPPKKIDLRWDTLPVTLLEYPQSRRAALSKGGADKLLAVQTSPGPHTLWVRYDTALSPGEWAPTETVISVRKGNTFTVLLLRAKGTFKGLALEHEVLEIPLPGKKEDLLQINLRTALFHYHLGQYPEAAALLLGGLEFQQIPARRAELQLWLGRTYLEWGHVGQAIEAFQRVMEQTGSEDRVLTQARYSLQRSRYRQGDFEAVISSYRPDGSGFSPLAQPEIHYLAGQSYLRQKNYAQAIAALNHIPRSSEFYPYGLYSLGLAYLRFGDAFAAQQAFKKLTELNIQDQPALAGLIDRGTLTFGLMLIEQRRFQEAISVLGGVSTQSRLFDQALFGLGWSYMKLEEYVKAIVVFNDLIEKSPGSPYADEARLMKGFCYSKLRAYAKAVDSYRSLLEITSREVSSLMQKMQAVRADGPDLALLTQSFEPLNVEETEGVRKAVKRYQELSRLLSSEPGPPRLSATYKELRPELKELERRYAALLQEIALQELQKRRERLEDLSVQAGIGIAKNLALEKTEFGRQKLVLQ